jgi:hypothetical protein
MTPNLSDDDYEDDDDSEEEEVNSMIRGTLNG